ncbi:MAG: tetratricopeptide repeat protein [Thermoplasmata archaeon]|nr:MAG: tetratricopeptide repeat protein [Thermoplasmata archaeon]
MKVQSNGSKLDDESDTAEEEMYLEESLRWYETKLEKNPNDTGLLNTIGVILENLGEREEALNIYMQIVELDPHNVNSWYRIGVLLENLGDYDAALDSYNEAVNSNPKFVEGWFRIGKLFQWKNYYENAKECYEWILDIDPNHTEAEEALASLNEKGSDMPTGNQTPQGLKNTETKKVKLRKFKRKKKMKVTKPEEERPPVKETMANESPKENSITVESFLEKEEPLALVETPKENKSPITLEDLVDSLEELHALLIKQTQERAFNSEEELKNYVEEKEQEIENSISEVNEFTQQLYELRDLCIQHTEELTGLTLEDNLKDEFQMSVSLKEDFDNLDPSTIPPNEDLIYPEYDDLNTKLDELAGLFSQTDDNLDYTGADNIESGLEVLQRMFNQNEDTLESYLGNDYGAVKNEVNIKSATTDDQTLSQIKEFEEALNSYNKSHELTSQSLDAWDTNSELMPEIFEEEISLDDLIAQGRKYMKNREFDKALSCFDRVLELDPQYLDAWSAKGDLMLQMSRDEVSLEKLVIEGRLHMEKREFDLALGCFERALELDPQCLDAWSSKGIVLMEMEKGKKKKVIS